MRRTTRHLTAAAMCVVAVTAFAGVAIDQAAASSRSTCAYGAASSATRAIERTAISDAAARFEASLSSVSAADRKAAGARFRRDLAAYVYGYPIVMAHRSIADLPANRLISIGQLATPADKTVVSPNNDTLYTVAHVDLAQGPLVLQAPPTDGRYSVVQLLDAFTDVTAYVGRGQNATDGESAVLVPPGYSGTIPTGLRVLRPASPDVWLLGRTLADGPTGTQQAIQLLSHYSLTPLSAYELGVRTAPVILPQFPALHPTVAPAGASFFDELGADLAADPPPASDACALSAFEADGIGAGLTPSASQTGLAAAALQAAGDAGKATLGSIAREIAHEPSLASRGWSETLPDAGRFGTHYADRAAVADVGLAANTSAVALYLSTTQDSERRKLDGRQIYELHFKPHQTPPVKAFWSVTLYNSQLEFYANPELRYSIGDRTAGLRHDADGGLTLIVSHARPAKSDRSNWLPAPKGAFRLTLRLYGPGNSARKRTWMPPAVVRCDRSCP